jgi:NAD(P)-dependent dehydrogenase (short-subunit alcohol dehydrogenase family)
MTALKAFSTAQSRDPRRLEDRIGGRRILLTGASSGIGREAALRLGSARAIVALVARRAEELDLVAAEIARAGGRALVYPTDLSRPEEVDALVLRAEEDLGGVDVLVNNAGRSIRRPVERSYGRVRDHERLMAVNYFAALRLSLGFLPGMQQRGQGQIVNVSSMGTQNFTPPFSAYNASKGALAAWARTAAAELDQPGIRLTTVNMPLVDTAMSAATGAYDGHELMTAAQGADLLVDAITRRPSRAGPALGVFGELVGALAPGAHSRVSGLAFRRLPAYEAHLGRRGGPGRRASTTRP